MINNYNNINKMYGLKGFDRKDDEFTDL